MIPDIVTLGKPIGNGFPLSAVVTRREIAESYWKTGSQVPRNKKIRGSMKKPTKRQFT